MHACVRELASRPRACMHACHTARVWGRRKQTNPKLLVRVSHVPVVYSQVASVRACVRACVRPFDGAVFGVAFLVVPGDGLCLVASTLVSSLSIKGLT